MGQVVLDFAEAFFAITVMLYLLYRYGLLSRKYMFIVLVLVSLGALANMSAKLTNNGYMPSAVHNGEPNEGHQKFTWEAKLWWLCDVNLLQSPLLKKGEKVLAFSLGDVLLYLAGFLAVVESVTNLFVTNPAERRRLIKGKAVPLKGGS